MNQNPPSLPELTFCNRPMARRRRCGACKGSVNVQRDGSTVMVLPTRRTQVNPTLRILSAAVPVTTSASLPVASSASPGRIPVISWSHRTAGAQVVLRENPPLLPARVAIARTLASSDFTPNDDFMDGQHRSVLARSVRHRIVANEKVEVYEEVERRFS